MLKSDTVKAYRQQQDLVEGTASSLSSSTHSSSHKIILTDDKVELYIQAIFDVSPRSATGTAPAYEWLQFLELYNEREGHYILTHQQMASIKPYCEMNQDVEMTPHDFIRLIHIIRRDKSITPQQSVSTPLTSTTKKLFDSRPRSSKLISKKSLSHYYEDRASTNHPDNDNNSRSDDIASPINPMMLRTRARGESDFNNTTDPIETDDNTNNSNSSLLKALKKEKSLASRQLREYENRISSMSKEHSERILQLQTRLEYMNIEAEKQRTSLLQQKNKERERLDKIAELQAIIDEADYKNSITSKKQQKEVEKLKEKLSSYQETESMTESKVTSVENELLAAREQIRTLEKEKADLNVQLDAEKRMNSESRLESKEQQNEITKLMEIIDRQKFDLDEARSGLRHYTNSPALDKKSLPADTNSLAHEQIEAEYMKEIALLEKELEGYQKKLAEKEQLISKTEKQLSSATEKLQQSVSLQNEQKSTISTLSTQFDQQHILINTIKSSILANQQQQYPLLTAATNKCILVFTIIAWLFFLYHLFMILFNSFYFGSKNISFINPSLYLSQLLDEWFNKHLSR